MPSKRLKCPKCWYEAEYELSGRRRGIYMGKLAILVSCGKCGRDIYTPDTLILDELEEVDDE